MSATPPDDLITVLRRHVVAELVARRIVWEPTGDGEVPYRSEVDGRPCRIRVNDFPEEPLYSLLVEDEVLADLEEWPAAWVKPPMAGMSPEQPTRSP